MAFKIVRKDIAEVKADAVVDTADAGAAAGEVNIRPVHLFSAKYSVQCSVPLWQDGKQGEAALLRECYDKALRLAEGHNCRSIVFPFMAGRVDGFPKELGMQIALDSFRDFLEEHEIEIILAVSGDYRDRVSGSLFEDVGSYVKGRTVAFDGAQPGVPQFNAQQHNPPQPSMAAIQLPQMPFAKPAARRGRGVSAVKRKPDFLVRGIAAVRESMPEDLEESLAEESGLLESLEESLAEESGLLESLEESLAEESGLPESLDERLRQMYTDSFEKHLQQLINKKGMKNSEVYAAANISKQYFSKLMKGQVKPSKEKVLALAIGLRLNLDETVDFLRIAGYALSPVSQVDVVVEYFIQKQDYSVMKIDIVLFDYGLPLLSE